MTACRELRSTPRGNLTHDSFSEALGNGRGLRHRASRAARREHDAKVSRDVELFAIAAAFKSFEPLQTECFSVRPVTVTGQSERQHVGNGIFAFLLQGDGRLAALRSEHGGKARAYWPIGQPSRALFELLELTGRFPQFSGLLRPGSESHSHSIAAFVTAPAVRAALIAAGLQDRDEVLASLPVRDLPLCVLKVLAQQKEMPFAELRDVAAKHTFGFAKTNTDQSVIYGLRNLGLADIHEERDSDKKGRWFMRPARVLITDDGAWIAEHSEQQEDI